MSLLIKNWQMADWKELLKWAKIGANNAMIGEFTEVEEVQAHGRLIDADAFEKQNAYFWNRDFINPKYSETLADLVNAAPTIIEAEEGTR